jgi:ribonuclease R
MSKKKREERSKHKQKKSKAQVGKIRSSILSLLEDQSDRGLSLTQIIRKIGLKKKEDIKKAGQYVDDLIDRGKIKQLTNGHYAVGAGGTGKRGKELTGVVDHVNARFAYVNVGEDEDVYVKTRDLQSAMDGDTVKLTLLSSRHGEHREGRVTEVVKRNRNRFVGKIQVSANFAFVTPDFRKIHQDFFIYPENINEAKTGEKVIIEVTKWGDDDKKPEAKVVEILGKAGENEAEIHSIIAEFDLPYRFPENVQRESEKIAEGITPEEIKKRRDFREITTFTIDPFDAKDFDDAISFENSKMVITKSVCTSRM